ncbi:MAG: hypothetical protein WAN66_13725 [Limnoraphis robusta]
MNKRDIVQKFSTFLSFGDRQFTWQADPQLEQQMKRLVESDPEAKEEFWARCFLKTLREVSPPESSKEAEAIACSQTLEISTFITARHLSAYLQEACLWAAQKSYHKYKLLRHKYPLEEYFQIASSFANLPAKLFKNFNLEQPESNIIAYAKTAIFRFIRDKIYQQNLEAKSEKFGDYGLLKNLTFKELKSALISQGIAELEIDLYGLAWQSFNKNYQAQKEFSKRHLKPPEPEDLKQITDDYNRRLNQLDLPRIVVNEDKIQEMLATCIKAARNYRTKQFCPLEECNNISDLTLTPWDIIVQEEERQQVQLLVSKLFTAIPETGKIMLILWQGLNLTQSEIATVMKSKYPELQKQYQVARHLANYNKNIFKNFTQEWNQANPNNPINCEQDLERIKAALHDCFQSHCQDLLHSILEPTSHQFHCAEDCLICQQKAHKIQFKKHRRKTFKQKKAFVKAFASQLKINFNLPEDSIQPVYQKVFDFVDRWLIY